MNPVALYRAEQAFFADNPGVAFDEGAFLRARPTRRQVEDMEVLIAQLPHVEIPVRNYFSKGVYAREITIPAGTVLTGKIHLFSNLNILSKGTMRVSGEDGMVEVSAPHTVVSPPGTKRIALALTECVWTTIHGTDETDVDKIEAHFVCDTDAQYVAFDEALRLKEK